MEQTLAQYIEAMMNRLDEEDFWNAWEEQAADADTETRILDGTLRDGLVEDSFDWGSLA
jgi:hypothetical protein